MSFFDAFCRRLQSHQRSPSSKILFCNASLLLVRSPPSHLTHMVTFLQYMATISSRQMDMQKFIADGCREALLEEKRRFCFLADKHCMFSYQISNFHEKVSTKGELQLLPSTRGLFFLKTLVSVCLPRPERCCPWSFLPGRRSAVTSPKCQRRWRTWSRGCPPLQNHRRWSSAATGWGWLWFLWYTSNCQGGKLWIPKP